MSHSGGRDVSVVVPLFNEAGSLTELAGGIKEQMQRLGKSYEIVFINDGSTDSSKEVLAEIGSGNENIIILHLRRRFGKADALMAGFKEARGEIVITMDADLQDDPQEIPRFIDEIGRGYDLVCGWKHNRKDPLEKKVFSMIFNRVVAFFSGVRLHDMNCGFKAYKKEVTEKLNIYGELHRFIPVLAHWEGYRIAEIKVKHNPRKYGASKYGASRIFKGLFDFTTVLFLTKFNKRPMHLFGPLALLCAFLGLILNIYFGWQWLASGHLHVRPLLVLGWVLLILAIQFFSIGLLGEMISNIRPQDKK